MKKIIIEFTYKSLKSFQGKIDYYRLKSSQMRDLRGYDMASHVEFLKDIQNTTYYI